MDSMTSPAYLSLLENGELIKRVELGYDNLKSCTICPWQCRENRLKSSDGKCKTGMLARVCSYGAHFGEEAVLVGRHGSGTVFFGRCNLQCDFCQNHDISQTDAGDELEPTELADIFLLLQQRGCHNINLVSPSHVVPMILAAVCIAAQAGLSIPLVYNTGGYDAVKTLGLLDGVVDIYMPDMKYADKGIGLKYSHIPNYPRINQAAVREMHRQVGDLQVEDGIAVRGLLVRHLVLPNQLAGSKDIFHFLTREISKDTYVNIMDQFRPEYKAFSIPELNRRITHEEYQAVVKLAHESGLWRLD